MISRSGLGGGGGEGGSRPVDGRCVDASSPSPSQDGRALWGGGGRGGCPRVPSHGRAAAPPMGRPGRVGGSAVGAVPSDPSARRGKDRQGGGGGGACGSGGGLAVAPTS